MLHLSVEAVDRLGRVGCLERVRPERAPQPPHHDCGAQPVTGDVADHEAHVPIGQREHVVPIAADTDRLARGVAGREAQARDVRQAGRHQAALEGVARASVALGQLALGRERHTVGDDLQESRVLGVEATRAEGADVEHAEETAAGDERHAEQRLHALLDQERVANGGVIDAVEHDWAALGRDTAREALADRNAHTLAHLVFETTRSGGDQLGARRVEQQDSGGVDIQGLANTIEQLGQQLVGVKVGQGGVGDRLDPTDPLIGRACHGLGFVRH